VLASMLDGAMDGTGEACHLSFPFPFPVLRLLPVTFIRDASDAASQSRPYISRPGNGLVCVIVLLH
jgi:hypothetical protein